MKRQIRQGVFETNSSSMHSLVVTKCSEYYTVKEVRDEIYMREDGMINLRHGDMYFGRTPFQVLTTFKEKLKYILASMCRYKGDPVYEEVTQVVRSYIPLFVDFDVELRAYTHSIRDYSEEIKEIYGEGNYVKKDDYFVVYRYDFGGVDTDILSGFLEKENITITEFLKNKRYIVIVDGDEYCIYKDMKKNGLINMDNIEKEYTYGDWEENYEEANQM